MKKDMTLCFRFPEGFYSKMVGKPFLIGDKKVGTITKVESFSKEKVGKNVTIKCNNMNDYEQVLKLLSQSKTPVSMSSSGASAIE